MFEDQPSDEKINLTLAIITQRVVDAGHYLQWKHKHYRMINRYGRQVHYYRKNTKAMIIKAFDGRLFCTVNEKDICALEEIPVFERISVPPAEKAPGHVWIPPMDHPRKRSSFMKYADSQPYRIELNIAAY